MSACAPRGRGVGARGRRITFCSPCANRGILLEEGFRNARPNGRAAVAAIAASPVGADGAGAAVAASFRAFSGGERDGPSRGPSRGLFGGAAAIYFFLLV